MTFLIINYKIKEESMPEFIAAANEYIDESRKEVTNLSFDFGRNKNSNEYVFCSRWVDSKSFNGHKKTEHFKKFASKISTLLADNFAPCLIESMR